MRRSKTTGYSQGREAEATTTKMVRNPCSGLGALVLQGDHRITSRKTASVLLMHVGLKRLGGKSASSDTARAPWWQVFVYFIGASLQRLYVLNTESASPAQMQSTADKIHVSVSTTQLLTRRNAMFRDQPLKRDVCYVLAWGLAILSELVFIFSGLICTRNCSMRRWGC